MEFDSHDDPRHAMNWPAKKKIMISAILIFDSLAATFASSVFSPASPYIEKTFGLGREVVTLVSRKRELFPIAPTLRLCQG